MVVEYVLQPDGLPARDKALRLQFLQLVLIALVPWHMLSPEDTPPYTLASKGEARGRTHRASISLAPLRIPRLVARTS